MPTVGDLTDGLEARDRRALARLLTWLEADDDRGFDVLAGVRSTAPHPHVVGITGPPGGGKSTLTGRLVEQARSRNETVAVLAIDPSSPYSGGAILGDRIRMSQHLDDTDVFIRSIATRSQLGGLAKTVPSAVRALAAYGFDWVLVETVGVGQVEVDVVHQADTTVVVLNPGWGDHIQASKAGLLEIADLFVVNKADRPGATDTQRELETSLDLRSGMGWRPEIALCTATSGDGIEGVWSAVLRHRDHLVMTGLLDEGRRRRRLYDFRAAVGRLSLRRAEADLRSADGAELLEAVAAGQIEPEAAAGRLLEAARVGRNSRAASVLPA